MHSCVYIHLLMRLKSWRSEKRFIYDSLMILFFYDEGLISASFCDESVCDREDQEVIVISWGNPFKKGGDMLK